MDFKLIFFKEFEFFYSKEERQNSIGNYNLINQQYNYKNIKYSIKQSKFNLIFDFRNIIDFYNLSNNISFYKSILIQNKDFKISDIDLLLFK